MNRRGNINDTLLIIVIIAGLAIFAFFFVFATHRVMDGLSGTPVISATPTSAGMINDIDTNTPWVFDFIIIMMMFGLPLLSMILAFFNNISPFFFFASIGLTMLFLVVSSWMGDVWTSFTNDADMGSTQYELPMTDFVMDNFSLYTMYCVTMIVVGVFLKNQNSAGYRA